MRVEKTNKAFAYKIYSHFTQQCGRDTTDVSPLPPQNPSKTVLPHVASLIISDKYNILQFGSMCKASIRRGRSLS